MCTLTVFVPLHVDLWSCIGLYSPVNDVRFNCVILISRAEKKSMTPSKMTFRSFKRCIVDELNSDLSQVPWSVIDIFDDINDR